MIAVLGQRLTTKSFCISYQYVAGASTAGDVLHACLPACWFGAVHYGQQPTYGQPLFSKLALS